ncbi:MAG: hypothetical protein H8E44_16480 [Planctomycetes bacterium]|nr:hypothetical protein [Planctomycetota bacterium]
MSTQKPNVPADAAEKLDQAIDAAERDRYVLRLYVTGATPRSLRAIENIKRLCEEHLQGLYDLQVIDLYERPSAARDEQVVAIPTLIKKLPLPLRKLVGDLSDKENVLAGLDLIER